MTAEPDDLDGCDLAAEADDIATSDDEIAALALYADVDFDDPAVVDARRQEWEALSDV